MRLYQDTLEINGRRVEVSVYPDIACQNPLKTGDRGELHVFE